MAENLRAHDNKPCFKERIDDEHFLPLVIISSNQAKIDQFVSHLPDGVIYDLETPLFDEEEIKESLTTGAEDGINHIVEISRRKLEDQRKIEVDKGCCKDAIMLVSDSALIVPGNDGWTVIGRTECQEHSKAELLEIINAQGSVFFCGAVSFGRRQGQSVLTCVSFIECPLTERVTDLPIQISDLQKLAGDKEFKTGFIEFVSDDVHMKPMLNQRFSTSDFEKARPFVSGVTPQIIDLALRYGNFDSLTGPVVEDLISNNKFSTLGFYTLFKDSNFERLDDYYQYLIDDWSGFFQRYGGNCTLFTLALSERLKTDFNMDSQVVIYPSWKPSFAEGHSGLIVNHDGSNYWFDPGMSIPFGIPVNSDIPIAPVKVDNKAVYTVVRDVDGDMVPDVVLERPSGVSQMISQRVVSVGDFITQSPKILADIHDLRPRIKVSLNHPDGSEMLGVELDLSTRNLRVKSSSVILYEANFKNFGEQLPDQQNDLEVIADQVGIEASILREIINDMCNI